MTPLSLLQVERAEGLSLRAATVLMAWGFLATVWNGDAAAASECPAVELTTLEPILGRQTWTSRYQMNVPSIVSRHDGTEFLPSPHCTRAPLFQDRLIDGTDQPIAPLRAPVKRSPRANATVNRAPIIAATTGKAQSRIATVRIDVRPYSEKVHAHRARMAPIDIMTKLGERPSVIIGPTDEHRANQTPAINLFPAAPLAQSGRPPVDLSHLLPTTVPQPGYDESARMNATTTQAIHGGECAYGCP
jgi:hypothetical protein